MLRDSNLRAGNIVVFSMMLLLCGCAAGGEEYNARFLEKYLLDGERAVQEEDGERAERLLRQAVAHARKLPAHDWRLALAEGRLGKVMAANNRTDEAIIMLRTSVMHFHAADKAADKVSADLASKERGEADSLLGFLLVEKGDMNGARPLLEESTALLAPFWSQAKDEKERDTISGVSYARTLYGLARVRLNDGNDKGAEKYFQDALNAVDEGRIAVPFRSDIAAAYEAFLRRNGKIGEADQIKTKQEEYERYNPGGAKAIARDAWRQAYEKGREASRLGDHAQADRYFEEAVKQVNLYEKEGGNALATYIDWARVKYRLNDEAGMERVLKRAEEISLKSGGDKGVFYDNYLSCKAKILKLQRKYAEQEVLLKQQVALREELRGKDTFHVAEVIVELGTCHFRLNKLVESEADFRKAVEIFKQSPRNNARQLKEVYDDLIPVLEKQGKVEEVRKFKFDKAVLVRDMIKWDAQKRQE